MIWSVSDIRDDEQYVIALCQDSRGRRSMRIVSPSTDRAGVEGVVKFTTPVANDLLRKRNLEAIAASASLEGGARFFFTAHGVWLTESECTQLDKGTSLSSVKWETGIRPASL